MKTILFIVLGFLSLSQAEAQQIKVLTYNILHGENPNNSGIANLDNLSDFILAHNPTVVALQEVDSMTTRLERIYGKKIDLVEELSKRTGYTGYFAKAMDYAEGGYGEGILVKNGTHFMSLALPVPEGGEPRAAALATITLESGEKFIFAGTHLCHEFPKNRIAQVQSLIHQIDSLELPVIWAGDLNFEPDSDEYRHIPAMWSDAGAVANNPAATFDGEGSARIDYIWYEQRHFNLTDYQVLQVPYSDHFPVLATFQIK